MERRVSNRPQREAGARGRRRRRRGWRERGPGRGAGPGQADAARGGGGGRRRSCRPRSVSAGSGTREEPRGTDPGDPGEGPGDPPGRAPAAPLPRHGRPRNLQPNFAPQRGLLRRSDGGDPLSWPRRGGRAEARPEGAPSAARAGPWPARPDRGPRAAGRESSRPLAHASSAPPPAPRTRGKVGLEPARPVPPGRADRGRRKLLQKFFGGCSWWPPVRRGRMRAG